MTLFQKSLALAILWILMISSAYGQGTSSFDYNKPDNKGKFFVFWGWNISGYTKSDISFNGTDHDFILKSVKAKDNPTPWDASVYLNPSLMSIPQTNFKIGYFFNDHFNVSVGVDHMKYLMINDQTVKMTGYIERDGSVYNGIYNNTDHTLSNDFLLFEHTDGLNYINIELTRVDDVLKWFNKGQKNLEINLLEGIGIGALMPKTNATFLEGETHDEFHLAGYGLNLKLGLNLTFFRYFFIQGEIKGGFIDMPDIRYSTIASERANQSFMFWESNILFGFKFKIAHKNK